MKKIKRATSRAMLGLTQQEIAILLKVTRSQWSHYEANTRFLPKGAALRFLEMLAYMISPETEALRHSSKLKHVENKTTSILEKRLKENEYQLMVLSRKIASVQDKVEKYSKAVQLMDFLNSPEQIKKAANPKGVSLLTAASIANYTESKSQLSLLQIDQNLLQYEETLLKEALGKLS